MMNSIDVNLHRTREAITGAMKEQNNYFPNPTAKFETLNM